MASILRRSTPLAILLCAARVHGQELEPRAYSPAPVGLNFAIAAYGRSEGGVLTDPSAPISNIEAKLNFGAAGYGRTFGLAGHSASALLVVPYVWGDIKGEVFEEARAITRSGIGDAKLRLAMNLIGGPALTPKEFRQREQKMTLGTSLSIVAPTGQYDPDKLINIGLNRWAFKPEIGLMIPHDRWMFDAFAGVWLFTDNTDYFGGVRREQDPMPTLQGHVSYTVRPGLWVAFDATYYFEGQTTVNGVRQTDRKDNTRAGITASVPIGKQNSLKVNWSRGATTRIGSNFTTWGIAWQHTWIN
jgi:hypothetical protein